MSLSLTSIQAWRIHSEVTPCKLTGIYQNSQCIWVFFCIACFTWVRPPLRQICFTFLVHLFRNKPICGRWQFNKYLWSLICACWVLGLFFARTVLKSNVLLVGYLEFGKGGRYRWILFVEVLSPNLSEKIVFAGQFLGIPEKFSSTT